MYFGPTPKSRESALAVGSCFGFDDPHVIDADAILLAQPHRALPSGRVGFPGRYCGDDKQRSGRGDEDQVSQRQSEKRHTGYPVPQGHEQRQPDHLRQDEDDDEPDEPSRGLRSGVLDAAQPLVCRTDAQVGAGHRPDRGQEQCRQDDRQPGPGVDEAELLDELDRANGARDTGDQRVDGRPAPPSP
jgi:hypothetical protein